MVDTFKTLRIKRTGPSHLFEVCITIIVSPMRQNNTTAIGYPLRRYTLVLNKGRSLPSLLPYLTYHDLYLAFTPRSSWGTDDSPTYALLRPHGRDQSDLTFRRALHNGDTSFEGH